LRGQAPHTSTVGTIENPRAVLTRTNAVAVERVLREQEAGRKVHLIGGGTELVSFARGALDLMNAQKRWTSHPDLQCFTSWGEVCDYVSQDEEGTDLKLNVDLINRFGAVQIINALDKRMPQERYADLVVSTAHKSKGCEWETVQLAHDFPSGIDKKGEPQPLDAEQWRLLYVATTRGQRAVDVSQVVPVTDLMDAAKLAQDEYEEPGQMALV
jgi:superfamily I DNA/RNA helicase